MCVNILLITRSLDVLHFLQIYWILFNFFADCKIGDDCIDFASLMYLFNIKSSKEVICLLGI